MAEVQHTNTTAHANVTPTTPLSQPLPPQQAAVAPPPDPVVEVTGEPERHEGRLTRRGMEQVHRANGSVLHNGHLIPPGQPLPSEAQLATTHDERKAAQQRLERQMADLQRQMSLLQSPTPTPAPGPSPVAPPSGQAGQRPNFTPQGQQPPPPNQQQQPPSAGNLTPELLGGVELLNKQDRDAILAAQTRKGGPLGDEELLAISGVADAKLKAIREAQRK